jgi:hypothetical protein
VRRESYNNSEAGFDGEIIHPVAGSKTFRAE